VRRPPPGHRVTCVDDEVEDDLLQLARVGPDAAGLGGQLGDDVDVLADQPPQHRVHPGDDLVQVDDLRLEDLLAAEGEQLARQCRRPVGGKLDLVERRGERGIAAVDLRAGDVAVAADRQQQVVEVVGDPARELADRLHLLRLA
jgi:hypothetical protein